MAQTQQANSQLNLPCLTVKCLYKLVSEELSPSFVINQNLLSVNPLPGQGPAVIPSSRKVVAAYAPFADSLYHLAANMAVQQELMKESLEWINRLRGSFDSPARVASVIGHVSPTIKEVTPKVHGRGLLKAIGIVPGLALASVAEEKGILEQVNAEHASTGALKLKVFCRSADRLLKFAKRNPDDALITTICRDISSLHKQEILEQLGTFIGLMHEGDIPMCTKYLQKFVPALLWPITPQIGYTWGQNHFKAPGSEVIADHLMSSEAVEGLFTEKGTTSHRWNDAGKGLRELFDKVIGKRIPVKQANGDNA